MKTKLTFLTLLIIAAIGAKAQNLIAVQHGGMPKFYLKLSDAIAGALAGDTVLIPGGSFEAIAITKKICLIGVGHNPDSTGATSRTIIANIQLNSGADNGLITGIETNSISINSNLTGNIFSRSNIGEIYGPQYLILTNFSITENILGPVYLPGTNHIINNNIFTASAVGASNGNLVGITNCIIRNNLFLSPGTPQNFVAYALYATGCIVENNIFANSALNLASSNDILNNNVNAGVNGFDGSSQGSNNFLNGTPLTSIFPTYDPSIVSGSPDGIYKINFNIPVGSPYKNAGRDGTDIGIYGGIFPWKPGSIPFNPHFQNVKVSPQTDASGNLKVQITVAAQDH